MNGIKTIALTAFSLLALSGCVMTRVCNSDGGMEVVQREGETARISVDDICFSEGIRVDESNLKRNSLGVLVASVRVRNVRTDARDYDREDPFTFQYRFSWIDANGMDVTGDSSPWVRLTLNGGEAMPLQTSAPNAQAVKYIVRMRHVR